MTPPAPAACVSATVPVASSPVRSRLGETLTRTKEPGSGSSSPASNSSAAVSVVAAIDALISTSIASSTGSVATRKSAVSSPGGTVTDSGADTASLPATSITVTPPAGASAPRRTRPSAGLPPGTDSGRSVRVAPTAGSLPAEAGITAREAASEAPAVLAITSTSPAAVTVPVPISKEAVVRPAGTLTVAGSVIAVLSLTSDTVVALGTAQFRRTEPVTVWPVTASDGSSARAATSPHGSTASGVNMRSRWFSASATAISPVAVAARPAGPFSCAAVAGPLSPPNPAVPVPAMARAWHAAKSISCTTWPPASDRSTLPSASAASRNVGVNGSASAGQGAPTPTTVAILPVAVIRRTRRLPVSAT